MTPLERLIAAEIDATGPMTVADFMARALGHPVHGYYAAREPFGAAGDFVTAPEISQMFGEMVGAWLVAAWEGGGAPDPVQLVELGPGRGTLMADAWRVIGRTPLARAARLTLVETSARLRAAQAARLDAIGPAWTDRLGAVPDGPLLLVANEVLDALPVRQFLASPEGWRERLVGLVDRRLAFGLSAPLPLPGSARPGDWAERSPALEAVAAGIAGRIAAHGGAALLIDYGYDAASRPPGPTLQALRAQRRADPLERPGEADLTWLIDFDALARALAPLATATATQGAFLGALGIGSRAASLAAARPDRAAETAAALERLTAPDGMGTLFRALVAWAPGGARPPGLPEPAQ